jgi:hypothetical protein
MPKPKIRRRRPTYNEPTEKEVQQAWRDALIHSPRCLDDLEQTAMRQSFDPDPYKTAFNEGVRWLAGRLIGYTIDEPETKVLKNVDA